MRLTQLFAALASATVVTCWQYPLQSVATDDDSGYTTNSETFGDGFDDRVKSLLEHFHVPGISIAVVDGDETFAKVPKDLSSCNVKMKKSPSITENP